MKPWEKWENILEKKGSYEERLGKCQYDTPCIATITHLESLDHRGAYQYISRTVNRETHI